MSTLTIRYTPILFPDHTSPDGALSKDMRAQACWYFYLQAQKMKEVVGDDLEDQRFRLLDGELWMDTHYQQLAKTVALMYQLESPDEFAKAWDEVREEAAACGLPEPHDSYTRLCPRILLS